MPRLTVIAAVVAALVGILKREKQVSARLHRLVSEGKK
jgi:hypothetical protein